MCIYRLDPALGADLNDAMSHPDKAKLMKNERPAVIAKRLGVGLKALRLWEAEGLIKPHRLGNGWRVFRPQDVTDAWRVAALKGLGFPLRAIKALLDRGTPSFDAILEIQERDLSQKLLAITKAKKAIGQARAQIAKGQVLDADTLIHLYQETNMTNMFSNPVTEKLWEETYTPEQLQELSKRKYTKEDAEKSQQQWAEFITQADRLRIIGEPYSPEALDFGRRWFALVREFTNSDPGLVQSSRAFYDKGYSSPETAKQMPFTQEVWSFVGLVAKELVARGETIT
jgi:MerR family transcriptional regulator, thiopeptide resistance regulator